jgi:hypothetical protein
MILTNSEVYQCVLHNVKGPLMDQRALQIRYSDWKPLQDSYRDPVLLSMVSIRVTIWRSIKHTGDV